MDKFSTTEVDLTYHVTLPCLFDTVHALLTDTYKPKAITEDSPGRVVFAIVDSDPFGFGEVGTVTLRKVSDHSCYLIGETNYPKADDPALALMTQLPNLKDEWFGTDDPKEQRAAFAAFRSDSLLWGIEYILECLQEQGNIQELPEIEPETWKVDSIEKLQDMGDARRTQREEIHKILEEAGWYQPAAQQTGTAHDVQPTPEYLARLRQDIVEYFDDSDLHDLCFDMRIDYDNLPGQSKKDKARELIAYCMRTSCVPDLVTQLKRLRPKVSWESEDE